MSALALWQISNAARCGCAGSDDLCPCQNDPDLFNRSTSERETSMTTDTETQAPRPIAIVVADRGHVWVGEVPMPQQGDFITIYGARAVRRWGTSEGLNELAVKGPGPRTRLDAAATVKVATRAVIAIIPCEPTAWTA